MRIPFLSKLTFNQLAWGWMMLFLVLDVIFYRQRLLGDASYYLFQIVADKQFTIEHARPISIVSQWIPLLLTYLQVPAKWILVSYSYNEWLFVFMVFWALMYWLKDKGALTALIVIQIIANKENWYNPVSELIQGAMLLLVVIAMMRKERLLMWHYGLALLMLGIIIQSHPLQFLLVPMMFGMLFITEPRPMLSRYVIVAVFSGVMMVLRYLQFDEYEKNPDTWNAFAFNLSNVLRVLKFFIKQYTGFVLIFLLVVGYAFRYYSRRNALLLALLVVGYTSFIVYKTGDLFQNSLEPFERYMYPLSVVLGWALGVWVMERTEIIGRFRLIPMLTFLLVWDLMTPFTSLLITNLHINYFTALYNTRMIGTLARKKRLNEWMTYLQQFPEQKFMIRNDHFFNRNIGHDWTLLNESALVSIKINPDKTQQLIPENATSPEKIAIIKGDSTQYLYSIYETRTYQDFNPQYFTFRSGKLRFLNTDSVQSHLPDAFFKAVEIKADFPLPMIRRVPYYLSVKITNPHPTPIYSGHKYEQVYLSYHWLQDGKTIVADGERSRLMADVIGTMPQEIKIIPPDHAGTYTLVIDLMYENKKWCGINATYEVRVW